MDVQKLLYFNLNLKGNYRNNSFFIMFHAGGQLLISSKIPD